MIILGKNPGVVSTSSNTSDNNQEEYMVSKTFQHINLLIPDQESNDDVENSDTDTASENETEETKKTNSEEMTEDAIEYLAGWVAKKYKQKFPELGSTTTTFNSSNVRDHNYLLPSWIEHLSYGGLTMPSISFKNQISRVERIFKKITLQKIPKGPCVVKCLATKIIKRMNIEEKYKPVIHTYVKQRIFIRMKYLNHHQKNLIAKKRAKLQLKRLQKLRRTMT